MADNLIRLFKDSLWILLFIIIFVVVVIGTKKLIIEPILTRLLPSDYSKSIQSIFVIIVQLGVFYILSKYYKNIQFIASGNQLYKLLLGSLIAIVIMSLSIIILTKLNVLTIQKVDSLNLKITLDLIMFFAVLALFEEIMVRGIAYGVLRNNFGAIAVILITSVIFLVPHLTNKGITIYSLISILLGGIILGTLRELSGDIIIPFAFHFFWNLSQGFFGLEVSGGETVATIFRSKFEGTNIMTGGVFGIEASIITIGLLLLGILILYKPVFH